MADAYGNLKASELRTLLKSKHNNEPPKAMLKSQMLQLLVELDEKAGVSADATAATSSSAPVAATAPAHAETKEETKPAPKKSAGATKAKTATATTPAATAKSAASAAPKEVAKPVPAKAVTAKATSKATPVVKNEIPSEASSSVASSSAMAVDDPMSAARLAERAKRFGTSQEKAQMVARAERFGIPSQLPKDPLVKRAEAAQKREDKASHKKATRVALDARAERFGLQLKPTEADNEKKRLRAERFASDGPNKKPKLEEQ